MATDDYEEDKLTLLRLIAALEFKAQDMEKQHGGNFTPYAFGYHDALTDTRRDLEKRVRNLDSLELNSVGGSPTRSEIQPSEAN